MSCLCHTFSSSNFLPFVLSCILLFLLCVSFPSFFFFNVTPTTQIYTYLHTLSLHDALPIFARGADRSRGADGTGACGFGRPAGDLGACAGARRRHRHVVAAARHKNGRPHWHDLCHARRGGEADPAGDDQSCIRVVTRNRHALHRSCSATWLWSVRGENGRASVRDRMSAALSVYVVARPLTNRTNNTLTQKPKS